MNDTIQSLARESALAGRVDRWRKPFGLLELLSVVTVIAVVSGAIVSNLVIPVYQAKFSEAMLATALGKAHVIETIAFDALQGASGSTTRVDLTPAADAYLRGQSAMKAGQKGLVERLFEQAADRAAGNTKAGRPVEDPRALQALERTNDSSSRKAVAPKEPLTKYVDAIRVDRTHITVSGRIPGPGIDAYELTLTAAVSDRPAPPVVIWLCGDVPVPAGWVAERHIPQKLPPAHLRPSVCNAKVAAK